MPFVKNCEVNGGNACMSYQAWDVAYYVFYFLPTLYVSCTCILYHHMCVMCWNSCMPYQWSFMLCQFQYLCCMIIDVLHVINPTAGCPDTTARPSFSESTVPIVFRETLLLHDIYCYSDGGVMKTFLNLQTENYAYSSNQNPARGSEWVICNRPIIYLTNSYNTNCNVLFVHSHTCYYVE